MNSQERQIWNDHQMAIFRYPSEEIVIIHGREWRRDHVMMCPVCEREFYSYQPVQKSFKPYTDSPISECRQTCGHPQCWEVETNRHAKLNPDYLKACQNLSSKQSGQSSSSPPKQTALLKI